MKTENIHIKITAEKKKEILLYAEKKGQTLTAVVMRALQRAKVLEK